MQLEDITLKGANLALSTDAEVDDAEHRLGITFPVDYREYVTRLGEGILGGCYIRIYPPRRILKGPNSIEEWRQHIDKYWFWDEGHDLLTKQRALECVIIGDTMEGDKLVFHPSDSNKIYVLPRNSENIFIAGSGLLQAIDWLCSSGTLTEPFSEREFEPFDNPDEG
jgi:hypothetical protein